MADQASETLNLALRVQEGHLGVLPETCGHAAVLPGLSRIPPRYDEHQDFPAPVQYGEFADVWRGRHNGQDVAIKVIKAPLSKELQGKFYKDAVAWKTLLHPNVLPLVGVMIYENHLTVVSEWMENGNINEFVKQNPGADRFGLLVDVARGLTYIHNRGVIHGGLKSTNILIDNACCARITDIGLYAFISGSPNAPPPTSRAQSGATMSSSPETIHPDRIKASHLTRASDCYAFGKIIYETISGSLQPHNNSGLTVLEEAFKVNLSPLLGDEFAGILWELLEQCWEREPDARPGAEDILWCLERMLNMLKTPRPGEDGETRGDGQESMNNSGTPPSDGTYFCCSTALQQPNPHNPRIDIDTPRKTIQKKFTPPSSRTSRSRRVTAPKPRDLKCSNCGQVGHNKRSSHCPESKSQRDSNLLFRVEPTPRDFDPSSLNGRYYRMRRGSTVGPSG